MLDFSHAATWLKRCMFVVMAVLVWSASFAETPTHGAKPEIKTRIRLQLMWEHQAQFAGFYVAQSRNYYAEQGLDVIFLTGGPNINPITELQEGRADIAISWLSNAWQQTRADRPVTILPKYLSIIPC